LRPNILIIDDDDSNRMLVAFALRTENFNIYEAGSGGAGLEVAAEIEIDLALIDIELPDISGLDILEVLRPQSPNAILLILTANDSLALMRHACELGANGYIVKPFDLIPFIRFIKEIDTEALLQSPTMLIIDNRSGTRQFEC
jgi:two-component system, chemotaxis family, chemotaxis protein CheY